MRPGSIRGLLTLCLGLGQAHTAACKATADVSACKLAASRGVYLSVGFGDDKAMADSGCVAGVGTINALMFFVDFPDQQAGAAERPQDLHDVFLPAAAEWYRAASYGRLALNVTADASRFYRMPARAASYGWQRGLTAEAHRVYIDDALRAYTRMNPPPAVDVLYIVPTAAARDISFSTTYMSEVRTNGARVAKKVVTLGRDALTEWKSKVINHETGHAMCLPDMYPINPSGPTGQYVGGWDMMGFVNGPSPDYFAWDKWRLGWLSDGNIECVVAGPGSASSRHVLSALEVAPTGPGDVKAVVVRRNGTTALVAEARSRAGVDGAACAAGGVLLYTVDTRLETGKGSIRVLDARPGSGGCAGDELNDAPLGLDGGASSYSVPGWGVKVAVLNQAAQSYTISVDVS